MAKICIAVTPQVNVQYPWLTKADVGTTAFPMPDGVYQAQCILNPNDPKHAAFITSVAGWLEISRLEAVTRLEAQGGKGKVKLKNLEEAIFLQAEVDDEGEETGRLIFRVRQKRIIRFVDKKTSEAKVIEKKIVFLDSSGKELLNPPNVFSGAEVQIKGEVSTYYAADKNKYGISMKIAAVRIVELPEGGGQNGNMARGFDNDPDGFTGSDENFAPKAPIKDDFNQPPTPENPPSGIASDF